LGSSRLPDGLSTPQGLDCFAATQILRGGFCRKNPCSKSVLKQKLKPQKL